MAAERDGGRHQLDVTTRRRRRRGGRRRRCARRWVRPDSARSMRLGVVGVDRLAEDSPSRSTVGVGGEHDHRRRARRRPRGLVDAPAGSTYVSRRPRRGAPTRRCRAGRTSNETPEPRRAARAGGATPRRARARTRRDVQPPLSASTSASSGTGVVERRRGRRGTRRARRRGSGRSCARGGSASPPGTTSAPAGAVEQAEQVVELGQRSTPGRTAGGRRRRPGSRSGTTPVCLRKSRIADSVHRRPGARRRQRAAWSAITASTSPSGGGRARRAAVERRRRGRRTATAGRGSRARRRRRRNRSRASSPSASAASQMSPLPSTGIAVTAP